MPGLRDLCLKPEVLRVGEVQGIEDAAARSWCGRRAGACCCSRSGRGCWI